MCGSNLTNIWPAVFSCERQVFEGRIKKDIPILERIFYEYRIVNEGYITILKIQPKLNKTLVCIRRKRERKKEKERK